VPGTYVVTITGVGVVGKSLIYTLATGGGGGGAPGGSPTQFQYNLNSAILGGVTGSSYNSGTGAVAFPGSFTAGASGGVAGAILLPQGTLPSAVANNWLFGGQTTVSAGGVNWIGPNKNGTASGGVIFGSASGTTVTLGQSGDARHSARQTGVTATLTNQILCLAADCPAAEYELALHLDSTVTCGTPGPTTLTPTITFTDDAGTKTNLAVPLVVNGGTTLATTMALGNTTNFADAVPIHFWSTGAQNITFTLTYTACTVGTGTYSYSAQLVQKQ